VDLASLTSGDYGLLLSTTAPLANTVQNSVPLNSLIPHVST
jgi:hypothetical protein